MNIDINELGEYLKNATRRQAAEYFKCSIRTIERLCKKNGLCANPFLTKQAIIEGSKKGNKKTHSLYNFSGPNNPNWKNGISKNNYHYKKLQVQRYPERIKARRQVRDAVKNGKLQKQPCAICGCDVSFAHHFDYNKPLDIIWLCRPHHREQHGNMH